MVTQADPRQSQKAQAPALTTGQRGWRRGWQHGWRDGWQRGWPNGWRRPVAIWLAALLALAILSGVVLAGWTLTIDHDTLRWFTAMDRPGRVHVAWRVVVTGGQFVLVASVVIVMSAARSWQQRTLLPFIVCTSTALGMDFLLFVTKNAGGRTSPHSNLNEVLAGGTSYPSGHTANGTVCLLLIAVLSSSGAPRARRLLMAGGCAFAVGIANLVLAYHWPSDVIGGWLLGGLVAAVSIWLLNLGRLSRETWKQAAGVAMLDVG